VRPTNLLDTRLLGLFQKFDLQLKHGEAWPGQRCHVRRTLAWNGRLGNKAIEEARMMMNQLHRTYKRTSVLYHVLSVISPLDAVVMNSEIRR